MVNLNPDAPVAADAAAAPPPAPPVPARGGRILPVVAGLAILLMLAVAVASAWFAWQTQARVRDVEAELVKRQQDSHDQVVDARAASRQAIELARESAAKLALLEVRVADSAVQRSQVEELMQAVARSREENVLADLEAMLRMAMQQTAITGSAEPLLAALKQADERLARYSEPQLERVRRAVAADEARVKGVAVTDIAALTSQVDEAIQLVDGLPMLTRPEPRRPRAAAAAGTAASAVRAAAPAASAASAAPAASAPALSWSDRLQTLGALVWGEVRSLVRVTPIDQPEAMLIAPEQAFFLRENLKLRLLNARLALLSRQFDTVQSDLRDARLALERYFDRSARPVQSTIDLLRRVAGQAQVIVVPRPEATLAAIAAASAGR